MKANEERARLLHPVFPTLSPSPVFLMPAASPPPPPRIVVVTCMDPRIAMDEILGSRKDHAYVIRNAGGIVTDDVLRSVIVSSEILGAKEFLVVNHTDCAMVKFRDQEIQERLRKKYGQDASKMKFYTFSSLERNVAEQVETLRRNALIPKDTAVSGLIYDVDTRKPRKVVG